MLQKIYVDGSGNGRMAWYNEGTGESWSGQQQGLTNNEAEYMAIYNALEAVTTKEAKAEAEILSDSKLVVSQLRREWHIKESRLRQLFDKVHELIRTRKLKVEFKWIPREENKAGKYLG